jgi:hypothetical protein
MFKIDFCSDILFSSVGQMLVPATAEDLKSAGKITVSPNFSSANNGNSVKAVQIKVMSMLSYSYRKSGNLVCQFWTCVWNVNPYIVLCDDT